MNFPIISLGDVATIIAGQSPPSNTYNEIGHGLPFFQGKADFGVLHPIARKWCIAPKKFAESGDILISVRAPIGPTNIAQERCCIGRGLAAIRPNEAEVLRDFVLWNIKHHESTLIAKGQGSTFAAIGQQDIKSLKFLLPPLNEQRRIVDILNRASHIERLRARAADRLQQFIPALFHKMFGDAVANPMGWKVITLGDVCVLAQYGTSKKANDYIEGVTVLRMGNVTYRGNLNCTDLKHVELDDQEFRKYSLRIGDILFNRTNSRDLVGKTGLWDGRFEAVAASYFIRIRVDENAVLPTYVWAFLNTDTTKTHLFAMARGAIGQANINAKEIKSLLLPLPPLEKQREFAALVNQAYRAMDKAQTAADTAAALSASLMDRLLGR